MRISHFLHCLDCNKNEPCLVLLVLQIGRDDTHYNLCIYTFPYMWPTTHQMLITCIWLVSSVYWWWIISFPVIDDILLPCRPWRHKVFLCLYWNRHIHDVWWTNGELTISQTQIWLSSMLSATKRRSRVLFVSDGSWRCGDSWDRR